MGKDEVTNSRGDASEKVLTNAAIYPKVQSGEATVGAIKQNRRFWILGVGLLLAGLLAGGLLRSGSAAGVPPTIQTDVSAVRCPTAMAFCSVLFGVTTDGQLPHVANACGSGTIIFDDGQSVTWSGCTGTRSGWAPGVELRWALPHPSRAVRVTGHFVYRGAQTSFNDPFDVGSPPQTG